MNKERIGRFYDSTFGNMNPKKRRFFACMRRHAEWKTNLVGFTVRLFQLYLSDSYQSFVIEKVVESLCGIY